MYRLAILIFLIGVFYYLIRSFFPPAVEENKVEGSDSEMIQDPNCELYIPKKESVQRDISGTPHFFCSDRCAEEFAQNNKNTSKTG